MVASWEWQGGEMTMPRCKKKSSRCCGGQKSLNFVPGSEFEYSNSGYTLLAEIIERVSGKSLRDFSQEYIFGTAANASTLTFKSPVPSSSQTAL